MSVRPARYEDCAFIYELSQDPSVRTLSTRVEHFTYASHCQWWDRRFAESTSRIWIAETDSPVGYVRYGSGPPAAIGDAEVSIAVSPPERGRGVGKQLLETESQAKAQLGVDRIVALVRVENIASHRLFESAGYRFKGWEERMGKHHRVYIK